MNNIGVAFFDRPDGVSESGWMSDGPDSLARFTSVNALDTSVVWLTNIKWDNDAFALAKRTAPWLRSDNFLGFSTSALVKELSGSRTQQQVVVSLPAIQNILTRVIDKLDLDLRNPRPTFALIDKIELPNFTVEQAVDIEKDFNEAPWIGIGQDQDQSTSPQYQYRTYHWPRIDYCLSMLRAELPTGEWREGESSNAGRIVRVSNLTERRIAAIPEPHKTRRTRLHLGEPEMQGIEAASERVWSGPLKRVPAPVNEVCAFSMVDALALEICLRARGQLPWVRGWLAMCERMGMYARAKKVESLNLDSGIRITGYGKGKIVVMCRPSDVPEMDRLMMSVGFEPPATYGDRDMVAKLSPLSKLKAMGLPYLISVDDLLSAGLTMGEIDGPKIRETAERAITRSEQLQESLKGWSPE